MRIVLVAWLLSVAVAADAGGLDGRRLRIDDGRLVDRRGREITLRGVNARANGIFDVTFDDGRLPLQDVPGFDEGDAARMQALGMNLLRLPINWSALEPQPGQYAQAYLDRIDAVVDACAAHGIAVLLDFHQDGFSKEIGQDGAPRWVLDLLLGPDGYPYLGGPLGDLNSRRFAPHTLQAFADFFENESGIQDRAAEAAVVLARRFKRNRTVIGYEILNEPIVLVPDAETKLRAFHERVAAAIRTVDRRHLIVFEPNAVRNLTNVAPIPATPFPDARTIYGPHIYTYVFDGQTFTGDRTAITNSMTAAAAEASAWGSALFVGEYGIDPAHPLANEWITASLDLQDQLRAHAAFWVWEEISEGRWGLFEGESDEPGGERVSRTTALSRAFARAVPGRVLEHTFDASANTLRLRWQAKGRRPLEVFLPPRRYPAGATITCNGAPVTATPDPVTGIVRFKCGSRSGEQRVEVAPR
jgi:endoglycosylceramidase